MLLREALRPDRPDLFFSLLPEVGSPTSKAVNIGLCLPISVHVVSVGNACSSWTGHVAILEVLN